MKLVTIRDANLANKIILYRAPYDIEPENINGQIQLPDLSRITATIPTLKFLLEQHCSIAILTYVGRPNGQITPTLSTSFHTQALSKLLNYPIRHTDKSFNDLPTKNEIVMLENVRFFPEEDQNNDEFAKKLTLGFDLCVFDAFPQAHRSQASTTGIQKYLPTFAGFYLEQEYLHLNQLLNNPVSPFTLITGGAKITDKIATIENLLPKINHLLIGGALANVFLAVKGQDMKKSLIDPKALPLTKKLLDSPHSNKIILPVDLVWDQDMAVDLGPQTCTQFNQVIANSKTIFWNGTLGLTKNDAFLSASTSIANQIASTPLTSIIAGGDTVSFINRHSDPTKFTYLSLAGGATLEFLAGKSLPALTPLLQ